MREAHLHTTQTHIETEQCMYVYYADAHITQVNIEFIKVEIRRKNR